MVSIIKTQTRISSTWHETLQLNVKYILADIDMSMSDGTQYLLTLESWSELNLELKLYILRP